MQNVGTSRLPEEISLCTLARVSLDPACLYGVLLSFLKINVMSTMLHVVVFLMPSYSSYYYCVQLQKLVKYEYSGLYH